MGILTIEPLLLKNRPSNELNWGIWLGRSKEEAQQALTKAIEEASDVNLLVNMLLGKHIYVDGQCDTDSFITIPLHESAQAISAYVKSVFGEGK